MENAAKALYSEKYFQAYRNDPLREKSYELDRDQIEALKPEGGAIFDVGCGLGLFLDRFDSKKWKKFGIDVSDTAIAEARRKGIAVKDYENGYDYPDASFDVVVFRGTIQHLDAPFSVIKKCVSLLKPNGLMVFLATPNANSICYKLFETLPFIHPEYNFYIPSDTTLPNVLKNFGMKTIKIRRPYWDTPYARPLRDHFYFLLRCLGFKVKFPFWGNTMEVYAVKPE